MDSFQSSHYNLEDYVVFQLHSSNIFTRSFYDIVVIHHDPFIPFIRPYSPPIDTVVILNLAKQFTPFLNKLLNVIPGFITESPLLTRKSAYELLYILHLCVDCFEVIAPMLEGNCYADVHHRNTYISCLRRWKLYEEDLSESIISLASVNRISKEQISLKVDEKKEQVNANEYTIAEMGEKQKYKEKADNATGECENQIISNETLNVNTASSDVVVNAVESGWLEANTDGQSKTDLEGEMSKLSELEVPVSISVDTGPVSFAIEEEKMLKENAENENNASLLLLGENKLISGEGNWSKQGNDHLSMQGDVQGDRRDLSACEKDNELVPLVSHLMKGKMSHKMSETDKKIACDAKLCELLDENTQVLIVAADNVGSNQLQNLRSGLRGDSVVLIEKITMMKRTVRIHAEKTGNNAILNLIPLLVGNAGLIFTKRDLKEVSEEVAKCKVEAPARVGLVADHIRTISCAVAASNIIRNFSFMAENEIARGQNRHCLEIIFQCLEYYVTKDEELVTNARETIRNLGTLIDIRIFSSSKLSYIKMTEKWAVQAILGMLGSAIKAWHCAAAELLGGLILNPDNEPFLEPFAPQIYRRLVDIMSFPAYHAQAAAAGALYNLAKVNIDCRLKLASERWAVDQLLKVSKTPHPVPEVCREASLILENIVLEPQDKPLLVSFEIAFAEMVFSESRYADTFAQILYELTSRPTNKIVSYDLEHFGDVGSLEDVESFLSNDGGDGNLYGSLKLITDQNRVWDAGGITDSMECSTTIGVDLIRL